MIYSNEREENNSTIVTLNLTQTLTLHLTIAITCISQAIQEMVSGQLPTDICPQSLELELGLG